MDYCFASGMRGVTTRLCLAYDIGCQWYLNWWSRVDRLPEHIKPLFRSDDMECFVGIMHIHGHAPECQGRWCGCYRPGNAHTGGDNVEHLWAEMNPISASASRMGPNGRDDLLELAFDFHNFNKMTGFGTSAISSFVLYISSKFRRVTLQTLGRSYHRGSRSSRHL
jgi:hypothetical protein